MTASHQKWGHSLAVRIPKAFVQEAHIVYGATVDLSVSDGRIIISLHQVPEVFRLEDLLKGVTQQNIHAEVDTGKPTGLETW